MLLFWSREGLLKTTAGYSVHLWQGATKYAQAREPGSHVRTMGQRRDGSVADEFSQWRWCGQCATDRKIAYDRVRVRKGGVAATRGGERMVCRGLDLGYVGARRACEGGTAECKM